MKAGTILFDDTFLFADGMVGRKLLVVLNSSEFGNYIVVKTTSKSAYKGSRSGCQVQDRYPNYYLPKGSCLLTEHTWIGLEEFFEFDVNQLLAKHFAGHLQKIGELPLNLVKELLDCAIQSDNISKAQIRVLSFQLSKL